MRSAALTNIPGELQALPRWLIWKPEDRDGKVTKVPYNPKEPSKHGRSDSSKTWGTFDQAVKAAEIVPGVRGVGFVFNGDGIIGVDFDHVRNAETGQIDPEAWEEIVSLRSYTEVSPSGTGVHVICKGKIPGGRRRKGPREIYHSGRYFTFTGDHLAGTPKEINDAQPAINSLCEKWFSSPDDRAPPGPPKPAPRPVVGLDDDEIIRKAKEAGNGAKFTDLWHGDTSGYPSPSDADEALCCLLAFYTKDEHQIDRIFRRSGLFRPKWTEKRGTGTYGEITVHSALDLVKEQYGQGKRAGKTNAGRKESHEPHEQTAEMEACRPEALAVLQDDFLGYLRKTYALIHSGDQETIDSVSLAIACQSVINSQGIQPGFGGERGTGKTSSVKAALHLISPDWVLEGSVSDKALFHFLETPGRIVFSDDVTLSPEMTATIKRAMSNFQSFTYHRTLDKDRKRSEVRIAPRQVFLLTSVLDQGDDQLSDRQFKISFQKTGTANDAFLNFIKHQEREGREVLPLLHEVHVCRAAWEEIKNRQFRVINPYADQVRFSDPGHRRDVIMLYDFVKAFAVLRFMQRKQSHTEGDPDNVITLEADPQDVTEAIRAFAAMGPQIQTLKLSKDEMALWSFIAIDQGGEVTFPDLVERYAATGKKSATSTRLRRLLEGRDGSGGLLDKIGGLTVTLELREVSESKRRNVKVIKCTRQPRMSEYEDFATFDLPLSTSSPLFPDLPEKRQERMNPDSQKEPNIIINNNNNSSLVQEKVSSENDACGCASSSVSLCSCENGQGTNRKPDKPKSGSDSNSKPVCSCLEKNIGRERVEDVDKEAPHSLSTGNPYQGMARDQLAEILLRARNMPDNLEDPEAFKRAWQETGRGGGAP